MSKLLVITLVVTGLYCFTIPFTAGSEVQSNIVKEVIPPHMRHRVSRKGRVVIAVIDTGFDEASYGKDVDICEDGHFDAISPDRDGFIQDNNGHGTHVAGLIAMNAKVPYCLLIMKYYDPDDPGETNLFNTVRSFRRAIDEGVDMINYSGGGIEPSSEEKKVVLEALSKNIVIVVAAGNEEKDFKYQKYYPAMYHKDIIVVGNLMIDKEGEVVRAPTSNFGKAVDVQVLGTKIESVNDVVMTGTSQSTAIVTGRLAEYVKEFRIVEKIRKFYGYDRDENFESELYQYMGE